MDIDAKLRPLYLLQILKERTDEDAQKKIDDFVAEHEEWLKAKIAKNAEKSKAIEQIGFLSEAEIRKLFGSL